MIYCSGQIPLDPKTGRLVEGGIEAQTRRVLANLRAVLRAAGSDFDRLLQTTVYLADMNEFATVNAICTELYADAELRPGRGASARREDQDRRDCGLIDARRTSHCRDSAGDSCIWE